MNSTNTPKKDVYEIINEKITDLIESGFLPWQKGWNKLGGHFAVSHTTGKEYSLLNQLMIAIYEGKDTFSNGEYLTFKQALAEGGKVKAGEKGKMITFWSFIEKKTKEQDENGQEVEKVKKYPMLRYYYVFEVDQCEGIERKYPNESKTFAHDPIEEADKVINDYYQREGIQLEICPSNEAYYSPSEDKVVCPLREQFQNVGEFYSTLFHETTHSTGAPSRLNREKHSKFGDEKYSKEELVAEMGAAYSLGRLGIENNYTQKNSAAYLQNWLKALKNDKNLFVGACSRAEEAVNFIFDNVRPTAE